MLAPPLCTSAGLHSGSCLQFGEAAATQMCALIVPAQVVRSREHRARSHSQSNFVKVILERLCIYQGSVAQGYLIHTHTHTHFSLHVHKHMLLQRGACHKQWYWGGGMCCSRGNSELVGRAGRGGSRLTHGPPSKGSGGSGCQGFPSAVITFAPFSRAESCSHTGGCRSLI